MSPADIAVFAIILVAGLVSFSLGLVRVVLALVGWVGAGFATLYGFSYVSPIAREWISIGFVADGATGLAIFIVSLIILTFISHAIGRRIRSSGLSALDRSLGLVFGLGLGAVLVSLGYLVMVWTIDLPSQVEEQPKWIRTARTFPAVALGSRYLRALLPSEWGFSGSGSDTRQRPRQERLDIERSLQKLLEPSTGQPQNGAKAGYGNRERKDMDRLIKSHQ